MDDDINFTYEANTEVDHSCAVSLDDEMWVLGGRYQKRQVNLKLNTMQCTKRCFVWVVQYDCIRNKMYFRWARFKIADWQMSTNCLSIFMVVDVIHFRLELCFVLTTMLNKNVIRKFKGKKSTYLIETVFQVLMGRPSKQKHHPNSLILTSWPLDIIGIHRSLPDTIHQPMDWRPKSLIMDRENGN